jgi:hypothetical protein
MGKVGVKDEEMEGKCTEQYVMLIGDLVITVTCTKSRAPHKMQNEIHV